VNKKDTKETIEFDGFAIDPMGRRLFRNGSPVPLRAKAFDLLVYMISKCGEVVKKDEILESVWEGAFVEEANIAVQIAAIRRALGETSRTPRYILTIPGQGYKFVANVHNTIVPTGGQSEVLPSAEDPGEFSDFIFTELPKRKTDFENGSRRKFLYISAISASITLIFLASLWLWHFNSNPSKPQQNVKFNVSRLTFGGKVKMAVISPDADLVAYVARGVQGEWLTLRQINGGNEIKLFETVKAEFWGIEFSRDGQYIYYTLFSHDRTDPETYRIAALGGIPERITKISAPSVAFSPVEDKIAFLLSDVASRRRFLAISKPDGSDVKKLATLEFPETFIYASGAIDWSPSGHAIAAITLRTAENETFKCISIFNASDGKVINPCLKRFDGIRELVWTKSDEIIVIANDPKGRKGRIRSISISDGTVNEIDIGIAEVITIASNQDGSFLTTVQKNHFGSIRIIETLENQGESTEIFTENGSISVLAWLKNGQIAFRSERSGEPELWAINADGTGLRQLTSSARVADRGLCYSPTSGHLIFVSEDAGRTNVWSLDTENGIKKRLTDGPADAYPACQANMGRIAYQEGIYAEQVIHTLVPIGFGNVNSSDFEKLPIETVHYRAEKLPISTSSKWPTISADGRYLAYLVLSEENWLLKIWDRNTGDFKSLLTPANMSGHKMQFSHNLTSIYYLGDSKGKKGIWKFSLQDGQIAQAVVLTGADVSDFDISNKNGRVAVALDAGTTDVVLFKRNTPDQ